MPATAEERASQAVFSYSAIVQAKTKTVLAFPPNNYFPNVGERFLGFDLIGELGSGTFGRVYLAKQPAIGDRLVALKVSSDIGSECHALAQLRHTNIVPIYSVHEDESCPTWKALCMPYLGATTLQSILGELQTVGMPHRGSVMAASWRKLKTTVRNHVEETLVKPAFQGAPASVAEKPSRKPRMARALTTFERIETENYVDAVLEIAAALADGLAHAHDQGILHRDMKPANVIVTDDGEPMLVDFNLSEDVKTRSDSMWSMAGGTLPYMSPEQIDEYLRVPAEVDRRSDLYSLGVIVYELLTGKLPFPSATSGKGVWEDARVARNQSAPSARQINRAVSRRVDVVIRKCLECDPKLRYQTARELHEDLKCCITGRPLAHATDPYLHERIGQWAERHGPRIFLGGLTLFTALCAFAVHSVKEFELRRNALSAFNDARSPLDRARFELTEALISRGAFDAARTKAIGHLAPFDDGALFETNDRFKRLTPANRQELSARGLELSVLFSCASLLEANSKVRSERDDKLKEAVQWIARAKSFTADGRTWKTAAVLEAMHAEAAEQGDARKRRQAADAADPANPLDAMLCALAYAIDRRFEQGKIVLEQYGERIPDRAFSMFLIGFCLRETGEPVRAVNTWGMLSTDQPMIAQYPRLMGLTQERFAQSVRNSFASLRSLDAAVQLNRRDTDCLLARAYLYKRLKKYHDAIADARDAMRLGFSPYYTWSAMKRLAKEVPTQTQYEKDIIAEADAKLKELEPTTFEDWLEVGNYAPTNKERLAGFEKALAIRPWSIEAIDGVLEELIAAKATGPKCRETVQLAQRVAGDLWRIRSKCGSLLAIQGDMEGAYAEAELILSDTTSTLQRAVAATAIFDQIIRRDRTQADRAAMRLQAALQDYKISVVQWLEKLADSEMSSPEIALLEARLKPRTADAQ